MHHRLRGYELHETIFIHVQEPSQRRQQNHYGKQPRHRGRGYALTTITITDDNGRSTTYRVDGEIKHCVDQFHSHGMFGINLTDRRRLHTLQFTTGKDEA